MILPVGLIFVSILEVINLRDIEKDRLFCKQTFTVMPGKLFAKGENIFCLLVPFLCLPVL
jgi:1,4-dihydroxy-2-naphthoate octaprenyltransferase